MRLVEQTEEERAPFVRMADRYAIFFLPATMLVAAVAWAISGDPVRALAVFVVATPCPLILAAPIALMSGLSRAARAGVVVKGAATIEQLGEARSVLLDKTGTITLGHPELDRVVPTDGLPTRRDAPPGRLARPTLVTPAGESARRRRRPAQSRADDPGAGRRAVRQRCPRDRRRRTRVLVGSAGWLRAHDIEPQLPPNLDGGDAKVLVGVDGRLAGVALIGDRLRTDSLDLVPRLREAGIRHVALVTGDKASVAEAVGDTLGVDRVYAEQTPEEKLEVVRALHERADLRGVVMVGDGINDAPALALADVGIAMGSAGATVSSETADAVILVDRVDRVADAIRIGRRSLFIARQSVLAGIALSLLAMGFAAAGYLPPVQGALLQEVIDVAVILNALRALTD